MADDSTNYKATVRGTPDVPALLRDVEVYRQRIAELEQLTAQQTAALQQLGEEARTDPVTRLRNRRAFEEDLAHQVALAQRYGSRFSLVLFDIDRFKEINDTYGHPAGDELLRQFGKILASGHRASDLAARFGGDEFSLLLPQTDQAGAVVVAERIRRAVEFTQFQVDGQEVRSLTSAGAAEFRAGEDAAQFVARTDRALYAAKLAGRNCVRLGE